MIPNYLWLFRTLTHHSFYLAFPHIEPNILAITTFHFALCTFQFPFIISVATIHHTEEVLLTLPTYTIFYITTTLVRELYLCFSLISAYIKLNGVIKLWKRKNIYIYIYMQSYILIHVKRLFFYSNSWSIGHVTSPLHVFYFIITICHILMAL